MADNVGYTPGTGATVAADDIGGVHHQRVKISVGADGAATDLSSANPMPLGPLPAGTANIGDVDVLTVPAPLSTTGNGTAATALRVTVASDSTGVIVADTELPTAAALNDATVNPTTPLVGAAEQAFNGTTWDRVRTLAGTTTAAASPNLGILATAAPDLRYTSLTLAATLNSVQSWAVPGMDEMVLRLDTTRTGSVVFEVSPDDTNWVATFALDDQLNTWATSITPTAGKVYRVLTHGYRTMRIRVSSALSGTVGIIATASAKPSIGTAMLVGNAPHAFGYDAVNYVAQYTTAQTSVAIASNAISATQRLVVTSLQVQSYGTTAGTCIVYFGTGAYSRGTSRAVFDGEWAPSATLKPGVVMVPNAPFVGVADHELRITTTNAQSVTVNAWGYIIPA